MGSSVEIVANKVGSPLPTSALASITPVIGFTLNGMMQTSKCHAYCGIVWYGCWPSSETFGSAASAFVNNPAISPTTQTLIVAALGQLGNIPGQGEFIVQATGSQSENDALAYQLSAQLMAKLNDTAPVARITHLDGLTVCQTKDGTVLVPAQWDYLPWTPMTERFVNALKATKFNTPATAYTLAITGVVSPMAREALTARGVNFTEKQLPGPLR